MPTMLFYGNPVPLNNARHRNFRIGPAPDGFRFAGQTHSIPLMAVEFMEAAKEYPIVFAKAGETYLPVALVGLREKENLFIDANGRWEARYVPAFVRRYPFVLARGEPQGGMTVCIDEAFPGFSNETGDPLFDEQGAESQKLKDIIAFLNDFHAQGLRTDAFVKRLREHDLLTENSARVQLPDGQQFALAGLYAIDEQKLLKLDDATALEMFRSGEMALAYSHLISLSNIPRLADRLGRRG